MVIKYYDEFKCNVTDLICDWLCIIHIQSKWQGQATIYTNIVTDCFPGDHWNRNLTMNDYQDWD